MKRLITISSLLVFLLLQFSCKLEGLDIKKDKEIKLVQRGTKIINGSEGDVELIINDITNGETRVKIIGIDDNKIYYDKYLQEGDYGVFNYGDFYYRVKVNSFEEHFLHDDFAFIAFRKVPEEKGKMEAQKLSEKQEIPISPEEIRVLLTKIKSSNLQFIRNGIALPDSTMSNHLYSKYILNKKDIKTQQDFIKKVLGSSTVSGEKYQVITKTHDTINLVKWLNL